MIPAAKTRFLCPAEIWNFQTENKTSQATQQETNSANKNKIGLWTAWLPYILIGVLLASTRLNLFGLKTLLISPRLTVAIPNILGVKGINWEWNWGWCPGLFPFLAVCAVSFLIFRMPSAN